MRAQREKPGWGMKVERFQLDFRKYILIIPTLQNWTRLPGKMVRSLCLEVCK